MVETDGGYPNILGSVVYPALVDIPPKHTSTIPSPLFTIYSIINRGVATEGLIRPDNIVTPTAAQRVGSQRDYT
jgi:hypothetical protein